MPEDNKGRACHDDGFSLCTLATLTIGNDIVDLKEVTLKEQRLHPRFIQRVFTESEQANIKSDLNKLWLNWAAKEAAFKALKRIFPDVIFAHKQFELIEQKYIAYDKYTIPCSLELTNDYAYCMCANSEDVLKNRKLLSWVKITNGTSHPSYEIREFAKTKIAGALSINESDISFSDYKERQNNSSPASLFIAGKRSEHQISFSHHGKYLACLALIDG